MCSRDLQSTRQQSSPVLVVLAGMARRDSASDRGLCRSELFSSQSRVWNFVIWTNADTQDSPDAMTKGHELNKCPCSSNATIADPGNPGVSLHSVS